MPGPALHHLMANALKQNIMSGSGLGPNANYAQLQALLSNSKNNPYWFLGCQGPDFLFFNTKDWSSIPIGDAVKLYYEVYDAIENIKDALIALVPQPVIDAIEALGAAADAVVEDSATLTQLERLFTDMQAVVDALSATLVEMLKKFISDFKLYEVLGHPYRDGQPKGEWWWFDAMHYRKTGRYAKALLKNAAPDSNLYLYALGYLTHFTGDTVGHPYVNINDGGPYRTQSQRHKTGENYQDVFNMFNHISRDWNRSKLHAQYNFNFDGTISDDEPDPHTILPPDLAKLIADTLSEVFENGDPDDDEYGRKISPADVDSAYRLWYRWMKSATDTGTLPEPVPYSLTAELEDVWNQTMDNLDDIGDFLEDAVDMAGSFSILAIFIILAALIAAAVAAAAALIDGVLGALTTLTTAGIRFAASLIYDQLYNAFQNFRLGVALNGLAFPMMEHLDEIRFRQFKNTALEDPFGIVAQDLRGSLPKLKVLLDPGSFFHQERHLVYPPVVRNSEPNHAHGGPDSYFNATSLHYAFGSIPLDKKFIDFLAGLGADESQLKAYIDEALQRKEKFPTLGNALTLTEEIYSRILKGEKIPDFNLDADRGYGYPCWTQTDGGVQNSREQPEVLKQHQQQKDGNPITPVELNFIPPA